MNCEKDFWKVLEYRGAVVEGAYMTSKCSQSFYLFIFLKNKGRLLENIPFLEFLMGFISFSIDLKVINIWVRQ